MYLICYSFLVLPASTLSWQLIASWLREVFYKLLRSFPEVWGTFFLAYTVNGHSGIISEEVLQGPNYCLLWPFSYEVFFLQSSEVHCFAHGCVQCHPFQPIPFDESGRRQVQAGAWCRGLSGWRADRPRQWVWTRQQLVSSSAWEVNDELHQTDECRSQLEGEGCHWGQPWASLGSWLISSSCKRI